MRACPHCQAGISDYVIKCIHCDTWLVENPPETDWRQDPEEVARRAKAEADRQARENAFAGQSMDVAGQAYPGAPVVPSVPYGGETLAPVIIIPDAEPVAAEEPA